MIRVVSRAQFPVAVRGAYSGGKADLCRMTGRSWGGRQGAALIAWDYDRFVRAERRYGI